MKLEDLERTIALDKWYILTFFALFSTVGIYVNSITFSSPILGVLLSSIYFSINSIFLGRIFFEDARTNFRLAFGLLLLLILFAVSNGFAMFVIALEIFPIIFETKIVVVILSLITIVISLINHIQIRTATKSTQK